MQGSLQHHCLPAGSLEGMFCFLHVCVFTQGIYIVSNS